MRYGLADEDIAKRLEKSAVTAKDITVLNSTGKELAHLYVCSDISKSPKYMLPQMILLAKLFVKTITDHKDPLLLQLLAIVREQKKQDSGGHELTATKTWKKMRRIVDDESEAAASQPEAAASQSQPVPPSSILSSSSSSALSADDITGSMPAANDFAVHFPLLCVRNAKPLVRVTYSGVCLFFIFVNLVCLFVFLLILFCIAVGYVFQRSYAYFGPGLLGEWRLLGPKHTPVHSGS